MLVIFLFLLIEIKEREKQRLGYNYVFFEIDDGNDCYSNI